MYEEPTPKQVGDFFLMVAQLMDTSQQMGGRKTLHQIAIKAHAAGEVSADSLASYAEKDELARVSATVQWEVVQAWMLRHLPPGEHAPCDHPDHNHDG